MDSALTLALKASLNGLSFTATSAVIAGGVSQWGAIDDAIHVQAVQQLQDRGLLTASGELSALGLEAQRLLNGGRARRGESARTSRRARHVGEPRPRLEKNEQSLIKHTLETVQFTVYTIGTRRRGAPCPKCGAWVAGHQGTCQTEGLADLLAIGPDDRTPRDTLWVEAKQTGRGRLRPEQAVFRTLVMAAGHDHVKGDLDAVRTWLIAHRYLRDSKTLPTEARP